MLFDPKEILRWLPLCTGHTRTSPFIGGRVVGGAVGTRAPLVIMETVVFGLGHQFLCKEDLEGCIKVSFEDSNDPKLILFVHLFLFDHDVDDHCPLFVYKTVHKG